MSVEYNRPTRSHNMIQRPSVSVLEECWCQRNSIERGRNIRYDPENEPAVYQLALQIHEIRVVSARLTKQSKAGR